MRRGSLEEGGAGSLVPSSSSPLCSLCLASRMRETYKGGRDRERGAVHACHVEIEDNKGGRAQLRLLARTRDSSPKVVRAALD